MNPSPDLYDVLVKDIEAAFRGWALTLEYHLPTPVSSEANAKDVVIGSWLEDDMLRVNLAVVVVANKVTALHKGYDTDYERKARFYNSIMQALLPAGNLARAEADLPYDDELEPAIYEALGIGEYLDNGDITYHAVVLNTLVTCSDLREFLPRLFLNEAA